MNYKLFSIFYILFQYYFNERKLFLNVLILFNIIKTAYLSPVELDSPIFIHFGCPEKKRKEAWTFM